MGNCFSSRKESDPFSKPGRTLAESRPAAAPSVGQRLGGSGGRQQQQPKIPASSAAAATAPGANSEELEARRVKAAAAAEERAKATSARMGSGKIAQEVERQKKQTRTDTLKEASQDTSRGREIDSQAEWQRM